MLTTQTNAQQAAEAYAFRQLVAHLQGRTDVQNIEMMILSGFCRNCLSKWYHVGAAKAGLASSYDDACERVYGMSYKEWKTTHQSKASDEQLQRLEDTKAGHAKHSPAPPVAVPAPAAAAPPPQPQPPVGNSGMSDVCCVPEDELMAVDASACALQPRSLPMIAQPAATVTISLGILTVSDRASQGAYPDLSGPEIESCMQGFAASAAGARWQLSTTRKAVVPDEASHIAAALKAWSSGATEGAGAGGGGGGGGAAPNSSAAPPCTLILTTGGTGLSPRDVTPEATSALLERSCPGITELLLREAIRIEPLAALSRAAAGIRGGTLIVNLPGRPKAVRENLAVLMPLLGHALLELGSAA